jgi:hypothetical protein
MIGNKRALAAMACATGALASTQAQAHVKWFCAFDIAGQPRGLENVLCLDFELLVGLALIAIVTGTAAEMTPLGVYAQRALDAVTRLPRLETNVIIRAIAAFFFIALWSTGGIMLTPELKTTSDAIPLVQLAIAAGLVWRPTCVLSAAGIVYLFAMSISEYGWFHLMDYPIFLGLAAYLVLWAFDLNPFGRRPLDVFRYATAITLMWASVEKWAYPEWTFPLFIIHPNMDMGLDPEFFMRAAGAVEFGLAFGLIWTPLVRRISALMLLGMFVGAIAAFGKIDAIGHSVIIAVLVAIACDDKGTEPRVSHLALAPAFYGVALAIFIAAYYGLHTLSYGGA